MSSSFNISQPSPRSDLNPPSPTQGSPTYDRFASICKSISFKEEGNRSPTTPSRNHNSKINFFNSAINSLNFCLENIEDPSFQDRALEWLFSISQQYPTANVDFDLIEKLQNELKEETPKKTDKITQNMKDLIKDLKSYKNSIPSNPSPYSYNYSPFLNPSIEEYNPYHLIERDSSIGIDLSRLFEETLPSKNK